ncbi:FliH/SctL family protein [Fulvimonas sp. R45]|uniref:FliH/SctL family protein n=1 Tax=Fulvimonas sp. R45 TaxID=3045937 RepID=UPI00265E43F4|nr:FliH/SctL family protein [Fulvimonas sp. R45]MDO1528355.1 FliH/SctL family protein [Fulvimonas sp. R45]
MSASTGRDAAPAATRWEPPLVGVPKAPTEAPRAQAPTVAELEALQRAAHDEGYATGLAEGRADARHELRRALAGFEALLAASARPLQALDDAVERELAQLAMVAARRVVAHELRTDPALVARAVRAAAAALPAATRSLRVYLQPDDLALLRGLDAAEPHWELRADPALARGDCRIESDSSRLDARVETRLAALVDAVLGDDGATP